MNDHLCDVVNGLIELANQGGLSIAEVQATVGVAIDEGAEKLLLTACIVVLGIGEVSAQQGGMNAEELLKKMLRTFVSSKKVETN